MFWRRKKKNNKRNNRSRRNKVRVESMFDEKEIKKIMGSVM